MTDKTFIYNDTEVKFTGRTAEKELAATGRRNSKTKTVTLHEITPTDSENGSWKKWVRITDLYEIKAT